MLSIFTTLIKMKIRQNIDQKRATEIDFKTRHTSLSVEYRNEISAIVPIKPILYRLINRFTRSTLNNTIISRFLSENALFT